MKKRLLFFVMLPLAACIIGACSDELEGSKLYDDGFLHFNLLFNNSSANRWAEDDKAAGTRCEEPIELTSPDMPGLKLYLHTVVSDEIETPTPVAENSDENVTTRGQRITGEVFDKGDDPDKQIITTLGIWGKVGSDEALCESTKSFKAFNLADGTWSEESGWQVKQGEQELEIATWPDGATGTFYGVAPYPGNETNQAPGIEATVDNNLVPTLTYNMPYYEANHKDVLAARAEVTKNNGAKDIKLEFSHILSAVKFGGTDINGGISCEVKVNPNDNAETADTYTLTVTKIQVTGVLKSGTYNFDSGQWTTTNNSDNIGRCEINALPEDHAEHESKNDPNQTYYDINGDEQCLMMLPQDLPSDANVIFLCTVEDETGTTIKEDLIIKAPITTTTWEPGHTYTYTLSDTKGKYELITDMSNLNNYTFAVDGIKSTSGSQTVADEKTFTIRSRFHDPGDIPENPATGGVPVNWKIQYTLYNPDTRTWSDYKDGLPSSFYLKDPEGNVVKDLSNIPGSISPATYTLGASSRFMDENNPEIILQAIKDLRDNGDNNNYTNWDLSKHTIDGTETSTRNTANCYIVRGYGTFKFPLVYGNSIKNSQENPASYTERDDYMIFVNYKGKHITTGDIFEDTGVTYNSQTIKPCIVWMDERNLIDKSLRITEEDGLKFINFEILKSQVKSGSAIIGVKDSNGDIMWSWHIWVTPDDMLSENSVNPNHPVRVFDGNSDHDMTFMTQDLGWRTPDKIEFTATLDFKIQIVQVVNQNVNGVNTPIEKNGTVPQDVKQDKGIVTISGSNLYYMHGRKDPMPGNYLDTNRRPYDMVKNIQANGYTWNSEEGPTYMSRAIREPNNLLSTGTGDWMEPKYGMRYAGRWDPQKAQELTDPSAYANTKTIYDPSPVGFQVPPRGAYNVLITWGTNRKQVDDYNTYHLDGLTCSNTSDYAQQLSFYETGWRTHTTGGPVEHFNSTGYHWSAGVYSNGGTSYPSEFGFFLKTQNTNFNSGSNGESQGGLTVYCRNHVMAVRAVKEKITGLQSVEPKTQFPLTFSSGGICEDVSAHRQGEHKQYYYAMTPGISKLTLNYTMTTGNNPSLKLYASDNDSRLFYSASDLSVGTHEVEIPITEENYGMLTANLFTNNRTYLLRISSNRATINSVTFVP